MMDLDALDNLPDISILEDEGITLEGIIDDMVTDFQTMCLERKGEAITLANVDDRRIQLEVVANKIYQMWEAINTNYRYNFIKWMWGDRLINWAANFGYGNDGVEYATTTLQFTISDVQDFDVTIPAGTRASAGDDVFFATTEDVMIVAEEETVTVEAVCVEAGTVGNGYVVGQINIIVDPVNLIGEVTNISQSHGGHDEFTDDELKMEIFNYTNTYSTSGSVGSYEAQTMEFSSAITSAKAIADNQAQLYIYIVLTDGEIPTTTYCNSVKNYLLNRKSHPDTDSIGVYPPTVVHYDIEGSYYIPSSLNEMVDETKEGIEGAAEEFAKATAEQIGMDVDPGTLISYMMAAGAERISITTPTFTEIDDNEVAICDSITLTYNGITGD